MQALLQSEQSVELIRDAHPRDARHILDIYGPIVQNTALSLESEVPNLAEMTTIILEAERRWPWLVMQGPGRLFGFAYASPFSACGASRYTAETHVYVHPKDRGQNIGRMLMEELLHRLQEAGHHMAVASITLPNPAAVALHESLGYEPVGVFREAGRKFYNWHDVGFWNLELDVSR